MYVDRVFNPLNLFRFSFKPILFFVAYSSAIATLYFLFGFEWLKIPWVPLTLLGIALAFYVGFKNNSAYDRTWEARKIWGGIVNSSRSWGAMVTGFVTNDFAEEKVSEAELQAIQKRLIYRHIAWLYRLKDNYGHLSPGNMTGSLTRTTESISKTYFRMKPLKRSCKTFWKMLK